MVQTRTEMRARGEVVTDDDVRPKCYLARFSRNPCAGALRKCHLIEKQALARRGIDPWIDGSWVWGCGGPWPGLTAHHGELDIPGCRQRLVIPPEKLPAALIALAVKIGFVPYLERRYGYERPPVPCTPINVTEL